MLEFNFEGVWDGATVCIIANGASLDKRQVDVIDIQIDIKTIVINDAYKLIPWADILYACDNQWWDWHNGAIGFHGLKVTHEQEGRWNAILDGKKVEGLPSNHAHHVLISDGATGFSDVKDRIRHGSNGGYQALHMAIKMGAKKIILLGYDMHANTGASHWFGEHPNGKQSDSRYARWIPMFDELQRAALNYGVEVINCTPGSALDCFVKKDLMEVV